MTEQTTTVLPEAPASWTVKYHFDGYDCMLTLRDVSGLELLKKAQAAINQLDAMGATPTNGKPINGNGAQPHYEDIPQTPPTLPDGSPDPGWCTLHNVAMTRRQNDHGAWYSHRLDDGTYCKGR